MSFVNNVIIPEKDFDSNVYICVILTKLISFTLDMNDAKGSLSSAHYFRDLISFI
jgi:hypothetical protein